MSEAIKKLYPVSMSKLEEVLGKENLESISKYLHAYDGTANTIKPVAKNITIYLMARATDRLIIRSEGEDDIILSQIKGETSPTIVFRKLKAVILRNFMELMRNIWGRYGSNIKKEIYRDESYDFYNKCSISPGIAGEGRGVMHGRCMKCPVDVLMGATSAGTSYNLSSRLIGESFYALSADYERLTSNAVDEVTYTTIMLTERREEERREEEKREEERTGALFTETFVKPGTMFVGKTVLFMPSPTELLYTLWLLTRQIRVGARTSIWGSLSITPVVVVADLYEVGSSYEAAEEAFGVKDEAKVREKVVNYVRGVSYVTAAQTIEVTADIINEIRKVDVLDEKLAKELWRNAKDYVSGVDSYIKSE